MLRRGLAFVLERAFTFRDRLDLTVVAFQIELGNVSDEVAPGLAGRLIAAAAAFSQDSVLTPMS